jgi:hypothetical protein
VYRDSALCNPKPYALKEVPWMAFWPDLSVERSLAGPDVSLLWLDEAGALEDAPEAIQEEIDLERVSICRIFGFN